MPTAFPFSRSEGNPDGATESARLLDNRIRELRSDLNAILGIPDNTQLTGPMGTMAPHGAYAFNQLVTFNVGLQSNARASVLSILLTNIGDPVAAGEFTRNNARLRFHNGVSVEDVNFPIGTRLLFDQDVAPVGWVRDVNSFLDDRMVRFAGSGARANGGSWNIHGLADSGHVHGLGAHVHFTAAHQHDLSSHVHGMSNHTHQTIGALNAAQGGGTFGAVTAGELTAGPSTPNTEGGVGTTNTHGGDNTGGPSADSHASTANITSNGTWRPLYRDVMICQKI